MIRAHR